MDNNEELKLTIRAKDEATATLKKVEKELDNVSAGMGKTKKSSEDMSTSIFKGAAMYDIFRTAVQGATAFFKESISESLEASRIMTQVETNVKNAGFAYDELAPKLKAYGENALKLGFDDEEAAQSVSKLLLVTKDYDQARALANLSMDLARAKNIDLTEATKAITMVTQGNTKALKEFGIEMGDNATTADILKEAQTKLAGATTNYAKTAGGQLASVTQEWANMKQEIGDQLMPTVIEFMNIVKENKATIVALADGFIFLGKAVGFVAKGVVGFGKIFATGISQAAETGTKHLSNIAWGLNKIGLVSDEAVKKTDTLALSWQETTKAAAEDALSLYTQVPKITATLDGTSDALGKVKNKAQSAGTGMSELKDSVASARKAYTDLAVTSEDTLNQLADEHREKMSSIGDEISRVKDQLKDLAKTYRTDLASAMEGFNNSTKTNTKSLVESIVANQDAISSIQGQLAGGGLDAQQRATLEAELATRLAAEETNATLITSLSDEIAKVKAYNSLSDLDRAVTDFNEKQALAQAEYDNTVSKIQSLYKEKKSALDREMKDLKEQQSKENLLYQERTDFIKSKQAESLATNTEFANANLNVTKSQVENEIKYYEELAKAIKAARSANTSEFAGIKNRVSGISSAVPKFEHGGTVNGPVGTAVPIIAHGGEKIISAKRNTGNGGGNIVLNINYPQFRSQDEVEMVRTQIEYALRDVVRIYKLQPTN